MVAVVDKSVLTLADEKTHRAMPTHFLLTSEVRRPEDLEYADFLLGPQAKASEALDLLLGVQGWRRFAEQDPAKFREKDGDKEEADRLLVMNGPVAAQDRPGPGRDQEDRGRDGRQGRPTQGPVRAGGRGRPKAASADPLYTAAVTRTAWYNDVLERLRLTGTPLAVVGAGAGGVDLPGAGVAEPPAARGPFLRRRGRQRGAAGRGGAVEPNGRAETGGRRGDAAGGSAGRFAAARVPEPQWDVPVLEGPADPMDRTNKDNAGRKARQWTTGADWRRGGQVPALAKPDAAKGGNVQAPMAVPAPASRAGDGRRQESRPGRRAGGARGLGGGEGNFGNVANLQGGRQATRS